MSYQLLDKHLLQSNFSKARHTIVLPRRIMGTDYAWLGGSASQLVSHETLHLKRLECAEITKDIFRVRWHFQPRVS